MRAHITRSEETEDGGVLQVEILCPFCSVTSELYLDPMDFYSWNNGELIQNAFKTLSAGHREQLISGICPTCWDETFGG